MIAIPYSVMVLFISSLWILCRGFVALKQKQINWKHEAQLLLVYICLIVAVRFTFCPFGKIDGKIQPLLFDPQLMLPFRINFKPFIYLFDYEDTRSAWLNLIGNISMFIPMGIVWPTVFKKLDRHWKVIAAGAGLSLCIEILQLPFFDRCSDIDDLLLNSCGYLLGYGLYLLVTKRKRA